MGGAPLPTGRHRIPGMGKTGSVGALQSPRSLAVGQGVTPYAPVLRGWGVFLCLSIENDSHSHYQAKARCP